MIEEFTLAIIEMHKNVTMKEDAQGKCACFMLRIAK
jgi:hypothetical protein